MDYSAEITVVWIVSAMVVASVTWLALHGWRQGRKLRRWAADRGFDVRRRDDGGTEAALEAFRRDDDHLVRRVSSVREIVELEDGARVFRCEEEMDLAPWSSGTGPPRTRVAVMFPLEDGPETYSVFDEEGRPTSDRAPGLRFSDPSVARELEARIPEPPHPLSVTVAVGRGLAYLLTPSGGVSEEDLDYLERLARELAGRTLVPGDSSRRDAADGGHAGADAAALPGAPTGRDAEERDRISRAG